MSKLISRKLKRKSAARKPQRRKQNVGTVREIGDGVEEIEGLTDTMLNEMLDFGNSVIKASRSTSKRPKSARSFSAIIFRFTKARKSRPPANCFPCRSEKACSAVVGQRFSVVRSTIKGLIKTRAFYPV